MIVWQKYFSLGKVADANAYICFICAGFLNWKTALNSRVPGRTMALSASTSLHSKLLPRVLAFRFCSRSPRGKPVARLQRHRCHRRRPRSVRPQLAITFDSSHCHPCRSSACAFLRGRSRGTTPTLSWRALRPSRQSNVRPLILPRSERRQCSAGREGEALAAPATMQS